MSDTHFDAVIIGSGFGGSVMAYRLAEAGMRVCLLERGKKYPPGSFPRSPYQMKHNFWNPSKGLYGLYQVWSFPGIEAVVSSGLGGGSLIYANVLLRKEKEWFVTRNTQNGCYEDWPITRADLDPHYDKVETMLNAQQYPFGKPPYNQTSKTIAFWEAGKKLNMQPELPKLAVTFANAGEEPVPGIPIRGEPPNQVHGPNVVRTTCRLCGECDIGCNYGSKNTLDYNYLSEAKRLGAEIWDCCEVHTFMQGDNGSYSISYVQHDHNWQAGQQMKAPDPVAPPLQTITADRLILAAGTFGTTHLLLKNKKAVPNISQQLGKRFSGNGDFLGFLFKCTYTTDGKPRAINSDYGPVITSYMLYKDQLDSGEEKRGFYIEDAGYPGFVSWILQTFDLLPEVSSGLHVAKRIAERWVKKDLKTDVDGYIPALFRKSELSSDLLLLLGMGRDFPIGEMNLGPKDGLDLIWMQKKSGDYFDRVRVKMREIASALGAEYRDDPLWYFKKHVITVHPLGGCPMGRDSTEGVVDSQGKVFNCPGLYIADGSVMPGPVGANPSLTIAALSDHFADGIIEEWKGKRT